LTHHHHHNNYSNNNSNNNSKEQVQITNVYRPPTRMLIGEDEREQDPVVSWLNKNDDIIAGDVNLHHRSWSKRRSNSNEAQTLFDWCSDNGFKIINNGEGTHIDRAGRGEGSPDVTLVKDNWETKVSGE